MKMQKLNKYFNIFFIISLICIITSIILIITYSFVSEKTYLTVNKKNINTIVEMLEKNEHIVNSSEIKINKDIVRIGKMQGLGDWYLYIKYNNKVEVTTILGDGESRDLYQYISENGSFGGNFGIITKLSIIISVAFIPIYVTFKICYVINKRTEKGIQKIKNI